MPRRLDPTEDPRHLSTSWSGPPPPAGRPSWREIRERPPKRRPSSAYVCAAAVRRPTRAGCTYASSRAPPYARAAPATRDLTRLPRTPRVLRVVRRERRPRSVPGQRFREYQPLFDEPSHCRRRLPVGACIYGMRNPRSKERGPRLAREPGVR
ncbi:hypothetical protein STPH2_3394 [Streptomyces sp. KO7888]|nr:hypothetical protein [Streptomyces sp. KO7888]